MPPVKGAWPVSELVFPARVSAQVAPSWARYTAIALRTPAVKQAFCQATHSMPSGPTAMLGTMPPSRTDWPVTAPRVPTTRCSAGIQMPSTSGRGRGCVGRPRG